MDDGRAGRDGLAMDEWLDLLTTTLGRSAPTVTRDERALLLELARVAARRSDRTAAPISTYLLGAALAGLEPAARAAELRRLVDELDLERR